MKRLAGLVFATLVVSAGPCMAITAAQFLQLYNSEDGQLLAISKIESMEAGVHEANEYLVKTRNDKPLYCQPPQLVLTGSQIADMLKRDVEEKGSKLGEVRLPSALLIVLQRTFPCP
jgi:predicted secreted protein